MFCPVCGDEYREGFTVCAHCEVPLVSDPVTRQQEKQEDDDPHRLVPVFESANPSVVRAALARLDSMWLPHSDPELPPLRMGEPDLDLPRPVQVLVARALRDEAELCLTGVEEGQAAWEREMMRHGFGNRDEAEEVPAEQIRYCPRCAWAHHGLTSCVDCGVPLVPERPARAEAERTQLLSTLDLDVMAAVRRTLSRAGIPFEWGRLGWVDGGGPDEPRPSPLAPAGWVFVPAAREREAREALGDLSSWRPRRRTTSGPRSAPTPPARPAPPTPAPTSTATRRRATTALSTVRGAAASIGQASPTAPTAACRWSTGGPRPSLTAGGWRGARQPRPGARAAALNCPAPPQFAHAARRRPRTRTKTKGRRRDQAAPGPSPLRP